MVSHRKPVPYIAVSKAQTSLCPIRGKITDFPETRLETRLTSFIAFGDRLPT